MPIREHLFHRRVASDVMFRWRGGEVSRLEGLSDGVFALTITLLVVSVEVPATWLELRRTVRDLPVFLGCFAVLMTAWRYHDSFFRRYGLSDLVTTALNAAFLFVVMFYAFPLKFLATFLWRVVLGDRERVGSMFPVSPELTAIEQRGELMEFYGAGVIGVFGLLAAMHCWAWLRRVALELDAVERALTVAALRAHLITVGVAALSVTMVALGAQPGVAGVAYAALLPAHVVHGLWTRSRVRRASG